MKKKKKLVGQLMTSLVFWLWTALHWLPTAQSLSCNVCVGADIKADCHLNQEECRPKHVCFVETSVIKYDNSKGQEAILHIYSMGCQHYSMCRDHRSHGPGPYGYANLEMVCCCTDRCEDPDGVGLRKYDNCPLVWDNYTLPNSGVSWFSGFSWHCHFLAVLLTALFVTSSA